MTEFRKFPKIPRLNRDVIVTEKIDGTNAQIYIEENEDGKVFLTGSRNRWITPQDDNHGFSQWAYRHMQELLKLGPGRHFGEWWGSGIQRGYGLPKGEKRFSLFNVGRWRDKTLPDCVGIVPVLWEGSMEGMKASRIMSNLRTYGSVANPGFTDPEGIVVYHTVANQCFKVTYDDTAKGTK